MLSLSLAQSLAAMAGVPLGPLHEAAARGDSETVLVRDLPAALLEISCRATDGTYLESVWHLQITASGSF